MQREKKNLNYSLSSQSHYGYYYSHHHLECLHASTRLCPHVWLSWAPCGPQHHSTAPPSAFRLPDGASCQGRPSAAQTGPVQTQCAPGRQPLLAAVTKDSIGFVLNEALLCIRSLITAIWFSSPNMPPHFARKFAAISKGRQLACGCAAGGGWGDMFANQSVWYVYVGENWGLEIGHLLRVLLEKKINGIWKKINK